MSDEEWTGDQTCIECKQPERECLDTLDGPVCAKCWYDHKGVKND
jgi:hypothetical protein